MGSGIAQACAQAGNQTTMMDIDEVWLDKAIKIIEWSLRKLEEKGKLDEHDEDIVKRITKTSVFTFSTPCIE